MGATDLDVVVQLNELLCRLDICRRVDIRGAATGAKGTDNAGPIPARPAPVWLMRLHRRL